MATKLGIQFARFAQYTAATATSNSAGTHGLRGAFTNASNGSTWAQGLSSGGSGASSGTSLGGAKFQAGRGAHSSFQVSCVFVFASVYAHQPHAARQNSGRALANANASSANDGSATVNDEDDEALLHSTHGAAPVHRSMLQQGRDSIFQRGLRSRLTDTSTSLQLILPNHHGLYIGRSRAISTSRSTEASATLIDRSPDSNVNAESEPFSSHRRSISSSASAGEEAAAAAAPTTTTTNTGIHIGHGAEFSADKGHGDEWDTQEGAGGSIRWELAKAARTGHKDSILAVIEQHRNARSAKLTTMHYNVAMESLYELRFADDKALEAALDLYAQMINDNCAPNALSYMTVVNALCARDHGRIESANGQDAVQNEAAGLRAVENEDGKAYDDGDFAQAMSLMDLAHSSTRGFPNSKPYNKLIYSCMLRSDTKTACDVLDALSANKHVAPTYQTFLYLIHTFSDDPTMLPEESDTDFRTRKLLACEQVFHEFEVYRTAEDWVASEGDSRVWNSMIGARILLGDAAGAVKLVEMMIGSREMEPGRRAAPEATARTSRLVIRNLIEVGDIVGATNWFERILAFDAAAQEDEKRVMPLPDGHTVASLFKSLLNNLPRGLQRPDDQDMSLVDYYPAVEAANRALSVIYDQAERGQKKTNIGWLAWQDMLIINTVASRKLIRADNLAAANKLVDFSLAHIEKQFNLHVDSLHKLEVRPNSREGYEIWALTSNSQAVLQTIRVLALLDRYPDSAACYSYACFAMPHIDWENGSPQAVSAGRIGLKRLIRAAHSILGVSINEENRHVDLNLSLDAQTHLTLTLEYVLPAHRQIQQIPLVTKSAVTKVYLRAREEAELHTFNLSSRGLNFLLNAQVAYNSNLGGLTVLDVPSLRLLCGDLAKLPEELRESLDLNEVIESLPRAVGEDEALSLLRAIKPSVALPAPPVESRAEAPESVNSADAQSEATVTGITSPSVNNEEVQVEDSMVADYTETLRLSLPTLQTIDADLGASIAREVRSLRTGKSGNSVNKAVLELFREIKLAMETSGAYPSPDGICALLDQLGRRGRVDEAKELYVIGSKVVASLGGDVQWQSRAWYDLEDGMITALAHGGESKLASDHRHKLINSGHVPRADAYAALITVIRDTTDDALVAEELFEESQRLGVRPTVYLYNTVLSKLSRARKAERAMQLFEEMRSRGVRPSSITYGAVLNACTRTGDEANAERFFAMMESDCHFSAKAPPYNTMLQFYTQTRPHREKALYYYEKFRKMRVEPNSHTYKVLLDLYGAVAPVDIEAMESIFGKLISDPKVVVQGNHWASVITAHGIHCNNLEKAQAVYHSIPTHLATVKAGRRGNEPDALAFEALLSVLLTHKRMDLIEEYIEDRKQKGCELTAYVANILIKAYAGLVPGDGLYRARLMFEEMKDPPMGVAAAGNHPLQRQHASGAQREDQSQLTEASQAQDGFKAVLREPSTFETMVRVEVDHGNFEEAAALVDRMQHRGYPPVVVAQAQEMIAQSA